MNRGWAGAGLDKWKAGRDGTHEPQAGSEHGTERAGGVGHGETGRGGTTSRRGGASGGQGGTGREQGQADRDVKDEQRAGQEGTSVGRGSGGTWRGGTSGKITQAVEQGKRRSGTNWGVKRMGRDERWDERWAWRDESLKLILYFSRFKGSTLKSPSL